LNVLKGILESLKLIIDISSFTIDKWAENVVN